MVYGARAWMPELASRHGAGIDAMLQYLLVTVGGLVPRRLSRARLFHLARQPAHGDRTTVRVATHRAAAVGARSASAWRSLLRAACSRSACPVWTEYFDADAPADAVAHRGHRAAVHVERALPGRRRGVRQDRLRG